MEESHVARVIGDRGRGEEGERRFRVPNKRATFPHFPEVTCEKQVGLLGNGCTWQVLVGHLGIESGALGRTSLLAVSVFSVSSWD